MRRSFIKETQFHSSTAQASSDLPSKRHILWAKACLMLLIILVATPPSQINTNISDALSNAYISKVYEPQWIKRSREHHQIKLTQMKNQFSR